MDSEAASVGVSVTVRATSRDRGMHAFSAASADATLDDEKATTERRRVPHARRLQ
jgi:hypothetical protein